MLGLYLHIPFCESICHYCNFNRGLLDTELKGRYLEALNKEIREAGDSTPVDSIFFGGGTPSLLMPDEVGRLVQACRDAFAVQTGCEVTLETNPETVTRDRVEGWREAGVTRMSVGVQSFRDAELARLGRRHTAGRARDALELVQAGGFDSVSLDLMLWLPEQTRAHCRESIATLVEVQPDHASLYLLELYPNAPLKEVMARAGWGQAADDDVAAMYLETLEATDAAGLAQYEISNVARSGKESRHNLKYWSDGEWLGFGCGAHSTRGAWRWVNESDTERYVESVGQGRPPVRQRHHRTEGERLGDALFTGLRLTAGVNLELIAERFGVDVMDRWGATLGPFLDNGWLMCQHNQLRLTRPGMLVANEVMRTFV